MDFIDAMHLDMMGEAKEPEKSKKRGGGEKGYVKGQRSKQYG